MCKLFQGIIINYPNTLFLPQYENQIAGMREETRALVQQHLAELNNLKAKVAYEIQEREKERADHQAMMK